MVSERKKTTDPVLKAGADPVARKLLPVPVNASAHLPESALPPCAETPPFRYVVVHSLPGRLRIQIDGLRHKKRRAEHLCQAIIEDNGVKLARLSTFTSSMVVEYDKNVLLEREVLALLEQHWNNHVHNAAPTTALVPQRQRGGIISSFLDFIDRLTPHPVAVPAAPKAPPRSSLAPARKAFRQVPFSEP